MARQYCKRNKEAILKRMPEIFENACKLIEKGSTINNALKRSGTSHGTFYKYATEEMKKEIKVLSMANKISSFPLPNEPFLFKEDEEEDD